VRRRAARLAARTTSSHTAERKTELRNEGRSRTHGRLGERRIGSRRVPFDPWLGHGFRGRLFVGDRGNNRMQIFDQDGKFLGEWKQFSQPSDIFVDANDTIYVADGTSNDLFANPDRGMGVRIGSAKDGVIKSFIPPVGP